MLLDPTWFPLVVRPRPPGRPLRERIAELTDLATPFPAGTHHQQASRAAEVLNKSALIAADCGLHELARDLCHRHFHLFSQAMPWPAWAARLALQPVLNIPRHLIRTGDGKQAHALLEALFAAACTRTGTVIDGRTIDLRAVTETPEAHGEIRTLVWTALLADGTRALIQAGCWQEATDQAAAHRGIGTRLLDGRQAAILAHLHRGQPDRAAAMVDQSQTSGAAEHAVQCLLRVRCQQAIGTADRADTELMLSAALATTERHEPSTAVARTRIGLTALGLTSGTHPDQTEALRATLITAAGDAYAARDLLHHQAHLRLTPDQTDHLQSVVRAAALGARTMPDDLHSHLTTAVASAEASLTRALAQASGNFQAMPRR
jgi:hypothetical protein